MSENNFDLLSLLEQAKNKVVECKYQFSVVASTRIFNLTMDEVH